MALAQDLGTRFRSYRLWIVDLVTISALLLISLSAQAHTKTVSETETPKIAAVNAALETLFRTLDTKSGILDPRIVAVAERQRDMQTALNDRLSFWEHVRMIGSNGFVLALAFSVIGLLRHMFRPTRTETEPAAARTTRGAPRA